MSIYTEERWRENGMLYAGAKVFTEGGEDLLACRPLFSKDQRWLFIACGSHVKVTSLSSRETVHILDYHTKPVTAIAINPRNHMQLITASLDGQLVYWDYTDGAQLRVVDFSTPLFKFKFRPGILEPSVYISLQEGESDYAVVGLSSHVITGRDTSLPVKDQLADAQHYLSTKKPNNFTFTYDGSHLVTFSANRLLVYDVENGSKYSYRSSHTLTSVDCHPQKLCVATGNTLGEIQLWYDFARSDTKVVMTTFHWHAHGVADVCFTTDGSYLLSGGEESVLVLWQLDSHKKQFRPRLGSPISKLACCHGDSYFAVSLHSNVICLLSGLDTEVEYTIGGLRKAYVQNPNQTGLRTGLVWCPRSNSILLNSTPGLLQFYNPLTDSVTKEMDVAYLNVVSRPDKKPLELTIVEHAAFSPDGLWLATVEAREDKQTPLELKMKLWEFSATHQRYILNTCVDPPHDDKVTGLTFQPSWRRQRGLSSLQQLSSDASSSRDHIVHMAITTSLDGRFKSWVLVDEKSESREDEKEEKKRTKVQPSWACRSVGYYHNLPCLGAAFSQDGSLLALNFKKFVTVWDPFFCDLLKTLNAPVVHQQFVYSNCMSVFACSHMTFGNHSSSQYLLASTTTHFLVWNMLTCTMQWCIKTPVDHLIADPFSSVVAVFMRSSAGDTNMYIFSPSSPTPLALHKSVCPDEVIGAVFMPAAKSSTETMVVHYSTTMKSRLYFMDRKQVLYSLKEEDRLDNNEKENNLSTNQVEIESGRRAFTEIFGDTKQGAGSSRSTTRGLPIAKQDPKCGTLLHAAPHVLPPMTILCKHYLKALLPSSQAEVPSLSETSKKDIDSCSGDEKEAASSDEEDAQRDRLVPQKRQLTADTETTHRLITTTTADYTWLTDAFKTLQ